MKICVLIRVFNRIEDLINNLKIIKSTWKRFEYDVVVSFNGKSAGYVLPKEAYDYTNHIYTLENNSGHLSGNSQLLLEGLQHICLNEYNYVILLESDTWLYTDEIIKKYVNKLETSDAVWASARWYDRFYSLATDFAIVKSDFLKNNIDILNYTTYPECYVCNYLIERNYPYIWIKENMNVQLPSYIKSFLFAPKGRFYVYPQSKMITHHIEHYKEGMNIKKRHFNIIAKHNFFKEQSRSYLYLWIMNNLMYISHLVDKCFLRRSWYSKRTVLKI